MKQATEPSAEACSRAVERAVTTQRKCHPNASPAERWTGEALPPEYRGKGWWIVGVVADAHTGDSFTVWLLPNRD